MNPSGPAALPDGRMLYLYLFCSGIFYLSGSTACCYFQGKAYFLLVYRVKGLESRRQDEQLHSPH